ncbi:MAG TPA: hypothetical protein VMV79_02275 [Alphaproteobacteria bacterium]|nr:hypothetical protein [Alphaproteobacteria bacterium]
MTDVSLLPPKQHRARLIALALMGAAPFAFGALAIWLGQDANWDLRNYHWYNAYAFLHWRYGFDVLPSQMPWFYNPLLDVPYYLLASHVPAKVAAYALGFVQGLNFILLFMLAYVALKPFNAWGKVGVCAALAALGMLGGGGIALFGTTFYDNVTSLGLFLSALLLLCRFDELTAAPLRRAFWPAVLAGLPAGLMMGFKLPCVVFCLGFCLGILAAAPSRRGLLVAFAFGIGILLGVAISDGWWMLYLQTHFGSPLFPYFNEFFRSPLLPPIDLRDAQFVPHGWRDIVLFPYLFAKNPILVGETAWRDWRIPILYVLVPLAVALRLSIGGKKPAPLAQPYATRYVLAAAAVTYVAWLFLFSIYRYLVPLEMLAPLLIVLAADLLPFGLYARAGLAAVLLIVVALSVQPGNWGRRTPWLQHAVEAQIPPLPDSKNLMILMAGIEPYAHLIPEFPPAIPFVRIESNLTVLAPGAPPIATPALNDIIRARIAAHKGPLMLLMPSWQLADGDDALARFGLKRQTPCQTVIDRLYNDSELALCPVIGARKS